MTTKDPYHHVHLWLNERNIQLNRREMALIRRHTLVRTAKPKEILMSQDQLVSKLYFLNSGIVRLNRIQDGTDHTLGLIDSRDFLSSPQFVLNKEISTCSLEVLTEADLLEWDIDAINIIKQGIPQIYNAELALMARLLNWVQQCQLELICLPAEKRYQLMLERQPNVLLNIPLKYIASFLNIHTDSLSRIRKNHLSPGKK
ncbi:Crp/Fnr family transcriptional regulator [Pseudoflavitalea sp. G-6-1-2]|uniref:Crp/Fnr family transcriptional regulator n=1 Tax=Pseudoflavitalea sp. G-6-1-2 TaxID=2728841 RepID=UPI00146E1D54|nr:Crp/Fnr family transcriptional regulator [Pseudoflavitalea sp. G-6-1-2]NML22721.1 Crp/Fnr family transcriptional regulator [Pseudoflavitalea sp. G-6-1-2]